MSIFPLRVICLWSQRRTDSCLFFVFPFSLSDYIRSRVVLSSECSPPPHRVSPAAQAFADFIARYPELLDMHLGDQAFHVPGLWGALERDAGVATEPGVAPPRRPAVDWFGVSYRSAFRCCNDRDPDVRTGCHWVDSNVCSPKDIATTTCVTVGCSEQNPKFMHEGCKKPGSNDVCCRASPNSRVGSKFWVFDDCSVPCIPAAQRCNTNLECCSKVCLQLDSKWNNAKICAKWKQRRRQGPFVDSILEQTRVHKPSICISMKRSCYASVSKYRIYEGIYCLFLTCLNINLWFDTAILLLFIIYYACCKLSPTQQTKKAEGSQDFVLIRYTNSKSS